MARHPMKPKMFDAVHLRLEGLNHSQISERIKTPRSTLDDWFAREDVQEYYDKELRKGIHVMFNKAMKGTERDLDSDNPWIKQNAQRMIIDKFGASILGEDKQEITIHLVGGTIGIGMPDRSEED